MNKEVRETVAFVTALFTSVLSGGILALLTIISMLIPAEYSVPTSTSLFLIGVSVYLSLVFLYTALYTTYRFIVS